VQAAVCGRALSWRSTPHLLFWMVLSSFFSVLQYTSDITVVPCWMNSALLSCPREQLPPAFWQTFVYTFLACLVNVCASTALTALWFQHAQMKHKFHHLLLIWCDFEIHCHLYGIALKSQSRSHSLCFVCTHKQFRNPSCIKLVIA
jgi:hypothetical protein